MSPIQPSPQCYPNLLAPLCRQALLLPLICLYIGILSPILQSSAGAVLSLLGAAMHPVWFQTLKKPPRLAVWALVDEQTSDPFVFLPVQIQWFGCFCPDWFWGNTQLPRSFPPTWAMRLTLLCVDYSWPVAGYPGGWGCGAGSSVGHFSPRGGGWPGTDSARYASTRILCSWHDPCVSYI